MAQHPESFCTVLSHGGGGVVWWAGLESGPYGDTRASVLISKGVTYPSLGCFTEAPFACALHHPIVTLIHANLTSTSPTSLNQLTLRQIFWQNFGKVDMSLRKEKSGIHLFRAGITPDISSAENSNGGCFVCLCCCRIRGVDDGRWVQE